jgi:hypothetical protein
MIVRTNLAGNIAKYFIAATLLIIGVWLSLSKVQPSFQDYGASSTAPLPPTLFAPFSTLDPRALNFSGVTRPSSTPGPAFGNLRQQHLPLPTNSWSQNLL